MIPVGETVADPAINAAETGEGATAPVPVDRVRETVEIRDVGAVVLGGDYQGLGIVRNLGEHGVRSFVIDDERSIARFSRHCGGRARITQLGTAEGFTDELGKLGARHGLDGWVVFPTRDETVAAIARDRDGLRKRFRIPTQSWDVVRWACDKRNTYRLAAETGVPTPRTWYVTDRAGLDAIATDAPLAIKPAIKENFLYATNAKAWRADGRAELVALFDRASSIVGPGEVMVQELIPGTGTQQYAYFALYDRGRPRATMVARRLRQHPPEFGRASTYVETVDEPTVELLSERMLGAISYDGLVELEYKLDPRDGVFKLLDFNARTCGYHSLAPAAGVDLPYLLFRHTLGLGVERTRARPGVRWVRLLTDVPTAAREFAGGRLAARSYLRSLRGVDAEAVFSRRDPWPGIAELALVPYLALRRGL